MAYSAITVANKLLELAEAQGAVIDPLKLLKLVYICHGWSFAILDRQLVSESIEAWQYGPVVPELYSRVKQYRYSAVVGPLASYSAGAQTLSDEDSKLISAVYNVYGKYSGGQLSNLTHQPGTPWAITWEKNGKNSEIPNELIADHYKQLSAQRKAAAANSNTGANAS